MWFLRVLNNKGKQLQMTLSRWSQVLSWVQNAVFVTRLFSMCSLQMKAVAGMKMSYNLQQAIDLSRRTIIRGFRQDETHSALCSHLFTMIRGNRQHRRAFLISLLKLFDDNAVSKFIRNLSGLICRDVNKTTGLAKKRPTLKLNVGYNKALQCEFYASSSSFFTFCRRRK